MAAGPAITVHRTWTPTIARLATIEVCQALRVMLARMRIAS
jgi:hypothetical protein